MERLVRGLSAVLGLACCGMLAGGCAAIISERTFVQDASVTAPAGHLPVHLAGDAEPGHPILTPMVSLVRKAKIDGLTPGHSPVNARGLYAVDTLRNGDGTMEFVPGQNPDSYSGSNFHWRTPSFVAGVDLDLPMSRTLSLSAGLSYANDVSGDLWGGHAGLGLTSRGPVLGMRFDLGVQWTPVAYTVASVVETEYEKAFSSTRYTRSAFYRDNGTGAPFGWYGGLTLNTVVPDWPVNPFLNLSLLRQRFFSYEPSQKDPLTALFTAPGVKNAAVESAMTLMEVSPGLALSVGPSQRVLLGVRMAFLPGFGEESSLSAPGPLVAPFVQMELGL